MNLRRRITNQLNYLARIVLPTCLHGDAAAVWSKWRKHRERHQLEKQIRLKWKIDSKHLPLTEEHWELYEIIHRKLLSELGEFPELINCRDFNDRINWLKLFDQSEEHVRCSDKIRVRDYVRERVGDKYLTNLYQTCDAFDEIDFDRLPNSFVIKTNHDSGGVVLVRDKFNFDKELARQKIEKSLKRTYGWENGEWAYAFIKPEILVEEFINPASATPPPDYKFHCANGKIRWLQYIYDRNNDTKEVVTDQSGNSLPIHFDHNMKHMEVFSKPDNWLELFKVAESIATGWKYVRVDMYSIKNNIYVGELTFFPLCGCYKSSGQISLGKLLDFDMNTYRPPIYKSLKAK
jgi:hypothetical protein